MCQLSNTVTNNDMKQGNLGTMYNFKHSIKKKKTQPKNPNKAEFGLYSRTAAKCMYVWNLPSWRERRRQLGCPAAFQGCPAGRGAAGGPPRRGWEGAAAASSRRAAGRDWAARALVAVGRCGNAVPSKAACLRGRSRKRFIYVPVLSQPPSRGGRCSPLPIAGCISSPLASPRRGGRGHHGVEGCLIKALRLPAQRIFELFATWCYFRLICRQPGALSPCIAASHVHESCGSCRLVRALAQPGK